MHRDAPACSSISGDTASASASRLFLALPSSCRSQFTSRMKCGGSGVERRASRCIVDDDLDDDAGLVALERHLTPMRHIGPVLPGLASDCAMMMSPAASPILVPKPLRRVVLAGGASVEYRPQRRWQRAAKRWHRGAGCADGCGADFADGGRRAGRRNLHTRCNRESGRALALVKAGYHRGVAAALGAGTGSSSRSALCWALSSSP